MTNQIQIYAPKDGAYPLRFGIQAGQLGTVEVFLKARGFQVRALFGPQHGIYGNTQDNMIEWEGFIDPHTGLPVYSLYGENRKPTDVMLEEIDTLVVDLPDVGSRYYTFLWTAKLCMEACAGRNIRMVVLDRPNPIGGLIVEGPLLNPRYRSFVGLSVLPIRPGMTMGELLLMINEKDNIRCSLEVVQIRGWTRDLWFDKTDLPWVLPSPNIPTLDSAIVYPGGCLLEGELRHRLKPKPLLCHQLKRLRHLLLVVPPPIHQAALDSQG